MLLKPENISTIEPPSSPKECLDWALSLTDPQTKDEKYKFHLIKTYFRENILSFNRDELEALQSKTNVMDSVRGTLSDVILTMCVEKNKIFPIIINDWKKSKAPQSRKIQYVRLLIKEKNEEQLRFFCKHHLDIVRMAVDGQKNTPDLVTNLILENFPGDLFRIEWSEEKKCTWINNHKHLIRDIERLTPYNASETLHEVIYQHLTQSLIHAEIIEKEQDYQRKLFNRVNPRYLAYLKQNEPTFLNTLLSRQIPLGIDPTSTVNHAQEMILNRPIVHLSQIKDIFSPMKELLSVKITNNIGLYQRKQSPFEWALENEHFQFFVPFSLKDSLVEEDKEIILAMAFSLIINKYTYNDFNISVDHMDEYLIWARERAYEATTEQFNKYYERAMNTCSAPRFKKELESIKLYISLNQNLDTNHHPTTIKKAKV